MIEIGIWGYITDLCEIINLPPLKKISPFYYQLNSRWLMIINGGNKIIEINGIEIEPFYSMFWYNGIPVFVCSLDNIISPLKENLECDKLSKSLEKAFKQAISRETENQLKKIRKRFN